MPDLRKPLTAGIALALAMTTAVPALAQSSPIPWLAESGNANGEQPENGSDTHQGGSVDDVRFERDNIHPELMAFYEMGPFMLGPDFDTGVNPPPANSSITTRRELENLHEMTQYQQDVQMREAIVYEDGIDLVEVFRSYGLIPSRSAAPVLWNLLDDLNVETTWLVMRDKIEYMRPRPSQIDPDLRLVVEQPEHPAYPSGHAAQTHAVAMVLASLDPERADEFMSLAEEISVRREIAAVHYPSDTRAGRILASRVAPAFLEIDDVNEVLGQARDELRSFARAR